MSQSQQELRRAAAKAFSESLDQLQNTVEPSAKKERKSASSAGTHAESNAFSLNNPAVWEDAVADIEQFMQSLQPESSQTPDSQS